MRLYSTRDPSEVVGFLDAAALGSPRSGGLFQPVEVPHVPDLPALLALAPVDRACALTRLWLGDEVSEPAIEGICRGAFTFEAPLVEVSPGVSVLELFHGPTLAFKDFGARFMARVLGHVVATGRTRGPLTILTATSGDTGAAVAHAFRGVPGVEVRVLYPAGRISDLQERLFCTLGGNVRTYRVAGNFDDCQALVKGCLADRALVDTLGLTSANSINFARLLAQTFYYFDAAAQAPRGAPLLFSVPSGNFGDLTAGLLAARMGLTGARLVASTNRNDVVPVFLAGGEYHPRESVATLSNAMDVGAPSNWERIRALFHGDDAQIRQAILGAAVDEDQTREAMRRLWREFGYLACPHTAVAWVGLGRHQRPGEHGVFLSTAHPAKFREVVEEVVGVAPPLPAPLAEVVGRPILSEDLPVDGQVLREALRAAAG